MSRVPAAASLAIVLMDWKKLLKVMLGTSLFLIESNRVGRRVRNRVGDLRDSASDTLDDFADRIGRVSDSLSGRRDYASPIGSFLIGVGIGAGLGLLFAPASGEETRGRIMDQAADLKDRVTQKATNIRDRASEKANDFAEQARETVRRETSTSSSQSSPFSRPA
jgi:gas vesicle protein